jgi:very-short-patch-repair endonuclease
MPIDTVSKLNASRKELLDLGLRNPLINYRTRARKIDVIEEVSCEIHRILVTEGKKMAFVPIPEKILEQEKDQLLDLFSEKEPDWSTLFAEEGEEIEINGLPARHVDTKLQTKLTSSVLHGKLLSLHLDARTYIEEQGINILYLALGFLHWYEAETSNKERRAPLLLIPVELQRASAKDRFTLSYTGDDIGENLSLAEKLKSEFAVNLPTLADDETVECDAYFKKIEKQIAGQPRWTVQQNEIVLGFFSFGKFLMYKDLADNAWPKEKKPGNHAILRALLEDGFREPPSSIPDETHIDELISPESVHQVLDADSTQTLAILDVNAGRNMIIQGPPGTGKSQTITNIIAESIGLGKKVLFVSEKMAALEVVKRRLDNVGLGEAVLELHSHKTNKRVVLEELRRVLDSGKPILGNVDDDIQSLIKMRDKLNAYCEAVNTPLLNSRETPIRAVGRYLALGDDVAKLPRMDFAAMKDWSQADYRQHRLLVEELQRRLGTTGIPRQNPFWGIQRTVLLPADQEGIRQALGHALTHTKSLVAGAKKLSSHLQLGEPQAGHDVLALCRAAIRATEAPHLKGVRLTSGDWQARRDDLKRLIEAGTRLKQLHDTFDQHLIPDAWEQDLLEVRQHYANYGKKWWRLLSGNYRRAKAKLRGLCKKGLPPRPDHCLKLIDAVLEARREKEIYKQHETVGGHLFGAQWQREESDWPVLSKLLEWIVQLYQEVGDGRLPSGIVDFLSGSPSLHGIREEVDQVSVVLKVQEASMTEVETQLQLFIRTNASEGSKRIHLSDLRFLQQQGLLKRWLDELPRLPAMVQYNVTAKELRERGLGFVLPHVEGWERGADDLLRAFDATWFGGLIEVAFSERRELQQFDRVGYEYAIEKFRELDRLLLEHNRARLALRHWDNIPKSLELGGELQILKRELNKKRKLFPIRKLIVQAGRVMQAIKPIFMMSPMSIAKFLSPGTVGFDIVVFDEASQVKPVDAFGAVMRGEQVVVVGDNKQLPPTSFFDSLAEVAEDDEEEETIASEMESILGLFAAQNAPERMLRWHYRSRHESLITVSNHEFYDDKLIIFPSPGCNPNATGLSFNYLSDTHYDRGRTRSNPEEAKIVAEAVMKHACECPDLTLGVAAFSTAQRDAITYQLEFLRRKYPSCEDFFNRHPQEPFFVKNLENVQGDERDVIFVSVGYGKNKEGYMSMNFGPVNREGGERRLNVLITRARQICEVFANFTADDIDLNKSNARGVVALKNFLAYARDPRDWYIETPYATKQETDSPFEEEVIRSLTRLGYQVTPQVGSAGFRVDIGIVDANRPGRYLLGIECDGATYHSARSARDRDRLREEVLKGLGWRIHRIWSTDWFRDPESELRRTVEAIEQSKVYWAGVDAGDDGARTHSTSPEPPAQIEREQHTPKSKTVSVAGQYELATVRINLGRKELHELSPDKLANYIERVAEVEGPVHEEVLVQRITNGAGLSRAGSRIQQAIQKGIGYAKRQDLIDVRGKFIWHSVNQVDIRDRSGLDASMRKFEYVAPEEIAAAINEVVKSAYSISLEEAISTAFGMLGFQRVTERAQKIGRKALKLLSPSVSFDEPNAVLKWK